jgi:hypothetical protein
MPPNAPTPCAARGKLETPQKQEQEHSPPAPAEPVPAAIPLPLLLFDEVSVETEPLAAVAVATLPTEVVPPTMLAAEPVPFWAIAICMKSACDFAAVGLIEKVMPLPQ